MEKLRRSSIYIILPSNLLFWIFILMIIHLRKSITQLTLSHDDSRGNWARSTLIFHFLPSLPLNSREANGIVITFVCTAQCQFFLNFGPVLGEFATWSFHYKKLLIFPVTFFANVWKVFITKTVCWRIKPDWNSSKLTLCTACIALN